MLCLWGCLPRWSGLGCFILLPAPAGTFTGTENEYARKAYAAGITTGTGDGSTFDPSSILTRQQMATFLYRGLQYVKNNSDTEYSIYTSKLNGHSDAGAIGHCIDPYGHSA